jgi:hypothetical protein
MALVNGTEYFYSIYFYDASGNYTRLDSSAIPELNIPAPVMTSLVSGDNQLTLTWDKVDLSGNDVDSYKVYYGFAPGDYSFTKSVLLTDAGFDPENPSITLTDNIFNNTTYWVTVSATYASNESAYAAPELSATPALVSLVPQPQNVYAVAGDAAFRIKWDNDASVDKWIVMYDTATPPITNAVEILPGQVQIDPGDGMAYFDVLHVDGVTPVVNDTLYFVRMWAEITGAAEQSPGSEIVSVFPQEGLVGFVDGLYAYSVPYYENIVGVPLATTSMDTLDAMTTTMQSPYTIYYDTSFNTYIPGLSQGGDTVVSGATAYIVGASDLSGEDIIVTGDDWSNDITSL